jgi:feruloyl esterase
MRRKLRVGLLVSVCVVGAALLSAEAPSSPNNVDLQRCKALGRMAIPDGQISQTQFESSGDYRLSPGAVIHLPSYCAVQGVAKPSPDSFIRFALWLPVSDHWNGKLEAVGNGGYSGEISYAAMARALEHGYAALSGDTGHTTPPGQVPESLAFGLGHFERIRDWGDRSIHAITMAAKPIVREFENSALKHSFFVGCSTGGHQALAEAERYPDDFDGIVAGAPGNNRTHLNDGFLWRFVVNNRDQESHIPSSKLAMITRAVVKACDANDGVSDGVISDPRQCHFDPGSLLCKAGDAEDCLTTPQIDTLRKLYSAAREPQTGAMIYPAWPMGSESGWAPYIGGQSPARVDYWRDWVFDNPQWSWDGIDWHMLVTTSDAKMSRLIDATNPDLSRFHANGGKLVMYQGWADPIGNSDDTIGTYEAVRNHNSEANGFVRLFMVPGMGHCQGGPGTDNFDMTDVLEQWVEQGKEPNRIVAAHIENGKTIRTRPLCPYPQQALYNGSGDPNDQSSFTCSEKGTHSDRTE